MSATRHLARTAQPRAASQPRIETALYDLTLLDPWSDAPAAAPRAAGDVVHSLADSLVDAAVQRGGDEGLAALALLVPSADAPLFCRLLDAIALLAPQSAAAATLLHDATHDAAQSSDARVRASAAAHVQCVRDGAALARVLAHDVDATVRSAVARALGAWGDAQNVDVLIVLLGDVVRPSLDAVRSLALIDDDVARRILRACLDANDLLPLRMSAAGAPHASAVAPTRRMTEHDLLAEMLALPGPASVDRTETVPTSLEVAETIAEHLVLLELSEACSAADDDIVWQKPTEPRRRAIEKARAVQAQRFLAEVAGWTRRAHQMEYWMTREAAR